MTTQAEYEIAITVIFIIAVLIMYLASRRNTAERDLEKTKEELQNAKIMSDVHDMSYDDLLKYLKSRDTTKKP